MSKDRELPKPSCIVCGSPLDYEPRYCCSAFDCGCRSLPIDPPVCSSECHENLMGEAERRDG